MDTQTVKLIDEMFDLLRSIFQNTPLVTENTTSIRIDNVGGHKYCWENGVDVRVSIDQLRRIQNILNPNK
jgi:hypothetical protein